LGFIRRKRDDSDRRNVLVQRTVKGSVFLNEFAQLVISAREAASRGAGLPPAPDLVEEVLADRGGYGDDRLVLGSADPSLAP
jgi:DNA-binding MarR family transcriptional regulator